MYFILVRFKPLLTPIYYCQTPVGTHVKMEVCRYFGVLDTSDIFSVFEQLDNNQFFVSPGVFFVVLIQKVKPHLIFDDKKVFHMIINVKVFLTPKHFRWRIS